jgi:hypothetical protein
MNSKITAHEKLFDDICSKLNELSGMKTESKNSNFYEEFNEASEKKTEESLFLEERDMIGSERFEKIQTQLRKSQSELNDAQVAFQDKLNTIDPLHFGNTDISGHAKRQSEQIEAEREANSKLSVDLSKAVEANLKLQLELQEYKAKTHSIISEEKKYSQFITEKNRTLQKQFEISDSQREEFKNELLKIKNEYQEESLLWSQVEIELQDQIKLNKLELEDLNQEKTELATQLAQEKTANTELNQQFEEHLEIYYRMSQQNNEFNILAQDLRNQITEKDQTISKIELEILDTQTALKQKTHEWTTIRDEVNAEKIELINQLKIKDDEIDQISTSLLDFEKQHLQQNEVLKNLMEVAEKKIIELKIGLDKKIIECQDYQSNLQQALTHLNIVKQENTALKDYIDKLNEIQNQATQDIQNNSLDAYRAEMEAHTSHLFDGRTQEVML